MSFQLPLSSNPSRSRSRRQPPERAVRSLFPLGVYPQVNPIVCSQSLYNFRRRRRSLNVHVCGMAHHGRRRRCRCRRRRQRYRRPLSPGVADGQEMSAVVPVGEAQEAAEEAVEARVPQVLHQEDQVEAFKACERSKAVGFPERFAPEALHAGSADLLIAQPAPWEVRQGARGGGRGG